MTLSQESKMLRLILVILCIRETCQQSYRCSREQFFALHKNRPYCIDCFCNGMTNRCRRAMYFNTKVVLEDVTRVKAISDASKLPPNAIYYSASDEVILGDLKGLGSSVVYWTLPREFLGNQAFAYGGFFKYTVFYDVLSKSTPYIAADVKIEGDNGRTVIYTRKERVKPKIALTNEVQIIESNFYIESGGKATRKDIMEILLNVKNFLVRATYAKDTKVTLLNDVSITSATPFYTRNGRAAFIEHCLCPQGYHGLSCELCQRGYTRLILPSGVKKCVRCQCNRHSLDCDQNTGECKSCQGNTKGKNCEECKDGYFGDATQGTTEDCKRCACPLHAESNQFSPTCHQTAYGIVKCDACKDGYRGNDCGECATGFNGNPRIPGGRCIKTLRPADRVPGIDIEPRRRTDPVGYRATFRCKVSGLGRLHVTWSRKDARPLPIGRSRVVSKGNSWNLIISSLKTTDQGRYVCTARNRYGIASYSVDIHIFRHRVPRIKVNVTPMSLRITEGSSALFLCTVNTEIITYTRSWSREGYLLLPGSAKVLDGTLYFHNARKEDSGVYTCSAFNQVSVDSATVVLSVGAITKPQISIWPLAQTVDVGKPVRFDCTSAGFPRPEIFWSRANDDDEEGNYSMSGDGVLSIRRVRVKDEGEYICTARNDGGEVSARAMLYVRSPNRILSISVFPKKVVAYIGERVVFRCASSGQDELLLQWNIKNSYTVYAKGGLLTFESVTTEDNGFYVCTASNPYGTVSAKVKLHVEERPKDALRVELLPETLVVGEGQSAILTCNITGVATVVTWAKDDGILSDNHLVNKYQLNITKATIKDKGTYFCIAKNKDLVARASSSVLVNRHTLPKIDLWPKSNLTVSVGDTVQLRCVITEGQPIAEMVWYKGNQILLSAENSKSNFTADLLLSFEKVQKKDEGTYFCAAVNIAGFASETFMLRVSGKPSVVLTPRGSYNATIDDNLLFECKATGYPVPQVKWILPSKKLLKFATLTSWLGYARMEMKASTAVEGKYICKAFNAEGEASDYVSIQVKDQPMKPSVTVQPNILNAVRGDRVLINCNPMGIPTPEFAWMRLRQDAPSIPVSKRNTLTIEDVQISDAGRYACRSWNTFGIAEAQTELIVSIPPTITVAPISLVVLNGRSFSLDCKATGYPIPSINWTIPNGAEPKDYIVKDGKLEVHSSKGSHAGLYTCTSENTGGSAVESVNVTVLVEPQIVSSSNDDNTAKLGQDFLLYCNGSGYPEPSISWYKDQSLLSYARGWKLSLHNLTTDSQGQYRCLASNLAGQVERVFSLAIEEVPTANIMEDTGTSLKIVPVGKTVTLTCVVSGNPGPLVRWTKTNGRLPAGVMVQGGVLKIASANVEDSGTYRCSAHNSLGFVHADIQVFVQGAPTVSVSPRAIQVQIGKEARIICSVSGMPIPKRQWKKIGGELPSHYVEGDQLIIPKIKGGDAGEYVCIAANSKGTAEDRFILRTTDFLPRFSEDGQSYIIYGKISGALYQTKIEMTFRHENENGVLLYNGKQGGDFLSLGLHQGYVVFQYNLGSGPAFIRSHRKVSLFDWHTLIAYRDGLDGTLIIDDDPVVYGKSKGKYTGLNLNGDLFVGGHANLDVIKRQTSHQRGFTGCISQILIAGRKFDIGEDALMLVGITDCNICLTQPCKNKGICLASASRYGYKCECNPGFTGESCKERVARCFPGACGEGTCSDTENSAFKCKCPLGSYGARCEFEYDTAIKERNASSAFKHGLIYQRPINEQNFTLMRDYDCSLEERIHNGVYDGAVISMPTIRNPSHNIEMGTSIKTPMFANHSYLVFQGIQAAWEELHIFMKFKPKHRNGVILLNEGAEPLASTQDYILVQLINGRIQLQFDAGSGPAIITHDEKVLINAWNTVEIDRYRQYGSISLNSRAAKKGVSLGHSVALNLGPLLFVGGRNQTRLRRRRKVGRSINATIDQTNGFNGCIQELIINGNKINLVGDFLMNEEIMDCNRKVSPCVSSPCLNNGTCQIVSAVTYKCTCPLRYFGARCEAFKSGCGEVEACQNGGTCIENPKDQLNCHCRLGYIGKACETAIQIRKEALFKGDGYLQFPRHLLSKTELGFLQFDIKTKADNGLIFWFGEEKDASKRENPDFLAIGLKNGFLEISYELGSGLAVILTERPFNDGHWHRVQVRRSSKNASLFVDDKLVGQTQSSGINTHLDIEAPIFFGGGTDVEQLTRQKFKDSYFGCIGNVYIENKEVFLQEMAENGRNVHPCTEKSI